MKNGFKFIAVAALVYLPLFGCKPRGLNATVKDADASSGSASDGEFAAVSGGAALSCDSDGLYSFTSNGGDLGTGFSAELDYHGGPHVTFAGATGFQDINMTCSKPVKTIDKGTALWQCSGKANIYDYNVFIYQPNGTNTIRASIYTKRPIAALPDKLEDDIGCSLGNSDTGG